MTSIFTTLPQLAAYHMALVALCVLTLAVLIQSFLTVPFAFGNGKQINGMPLKGGHDDLSFRVVRTHSNSTENFGPFFAAVFLAIIAGAHVTWVNWLAFAHVGFRLLYWAIYYSGTGKVAAGPRSMAYAAGWFTNLGIAGLAFYALIAG